MDNYKLVETFSEFKEFKNIDREAMMRIIEDVFRGMLNIVLHRLPPLPFRPLSVRSLPSSYASKRIAVAVSGLSLSC